ncbi:hypothetical protein [Candidatus Viridilinea mediisalina]|uniref:Uncharacterized protein n=1 Tax=Candidatus Viridilinea mediisalina TaxID=2024553 RepID=A0A2A6RL70_9CHLR|nr:hypothetical protein [Candidatus Viridilinea mediisalina]PDW03590.1 hypothetical protein CJ255_07940 [Candidatus Viridilinea mediisalina]
MGELLGALGLAWPRLLFYPGGIFALVAAWLLAMWLRHCARALILEPEATWQPNRIIPFTIVDCRLQIGEHGAPMGFSVLDNAACSRVIGIIATVPPLAVVSLLPLAPARPFPYGLDLIVALALLEWPRIWLQRQPTRNDLLHAYWPLLIAAWGWSEATGGLGLSRLLAWPEPMARQILMLMGTALWLTSLPPLLDGELRSLAARLRALGLLLIACLPLIALLAAYGAAWLPNAWQGRIFPLVALVSAALLLGALLRLPPKLLQRGQLLLALGLLGVWVSLLV